MIKTQTKFYIRNQHLTFHLRPPLPPHTHTHTRAEDWLNAVHHTHLKWTGWTLVNFRVTSKALERTSEVSGPHGFHHYSILLFQKLISWVSFPKSAPSTPGLPVNLDPLTQTRALFPPDCWWALSLPTPSWSKSRFPATLLIQTTNLRCRPSFVF